MGLGKIRSILKVIADIITFGRSKGWWRKQHVITFNGKPIDPKFRKKE